MDKFNKWLKQHPEITECINLDESKIKWEIDSYTRYMLNLKRSTDESFRRCLRKQFNITKMVHERLYNKVYGGIPSHFVLFLRGLQNVDVGTGAFKSSVAIEMMQIYDDIPIVEKIGFTYDELLEKVKILTKTKQKHYFFIKDETPSSLKFRSKVEFETLKESIRLKQTSFAVIKPVEEHPSASTFILEPLYRSQDNKYVKVAVFAPEARYIGFLFVRIHWNNKLWQAYGPYKDKYVEQVLNRQVNQDNYVQQSEEFLEGPYADKIYNPSGKINSIRLRKYVVKTWTQLTREETRMLCDTIREIIEEKQEDAPGEKHKKEKEQTTP